jgi:hypothetical protein
LVTPVKKTVDFVDGNPLAVDVTVTRQVQLEIEDVSILNSHVHLERPSSWLETEEDKFRVMDSDAFVEEPSG